AGVPGACETLNESRYKLTPRVEEALNCDPAMPRRGGRPPRGPADRRVTDAPPDPQAAATGLRPPRGPREEDEGPAPGDRQAAARAVQLGARGPDGRIPSRGEATHRVPGHAAREGARGPPREGRARLPGELPGGLPPLPGGARGAARGGGDRGGDVLQEAQGHRGPLRLGQGRVRSALMRAPAASGSPRRA